MTRKQDLPRVLHLKARYAVDIMNLSARPGTPARFLKHVGAAFDHAVAIDPTPKAIYLTTVIRWYRSGTMRYEDARRVRDILTAFHERKHELEIGQRDIGQYKSPGDISKVLGLLGDEIFVDVPDDIMAISPVVASGQGWAIHRISDTSAASWWADSTDWCTRHPQTAGKYLEHGDLYIVNARGGKLQFHVATGQLMDRHDRIADDLSFLPDQCLDAIRATVSTDWDFRRVGIELTIDRETSRRVDKATALMSAMRMVSTMSHGNSWISSDGILVYPCLQQSETGLMTKRLDSEMTLGTTRSKILQSLDGDCLLFDFVSRGVRDIASRHREWNIRSFTGWDAIGGAWNWLWGAKSPLRRIVSVDAHDILIWNVLPDDGTRGWFEAVDVDGNPGERAFRFSTPADVARAPAVFGKAVDILMEITSQTALQVAQIADIHRLPADLIASWRHYTAKERMLGLMADVGGASTDWLAAAELAFGEKDAPAVARLARRARRNGKIALAVTSDEPFRLTDLDAVIGTRGSGLLISGIPDELCTEEIIDRFLEAGRLEVISLVPSRFITMERLVRFFAGNYRPIPVMNFTGRIISLEALGNLHDFKEIAQQHESIDEMIAFITQFTEFKGREYLVTDPRFGRILQDMDQGTSVDDMFMKLRSDDTNTARLEVLYDRVPPVGCPWPLALERLAQSSAGLEDVLVSLKADRWNSDSEINRRMAQLMDIPHVAEAIHASESMRRLLGELHVLAENNP